MDPSVIASNGALVIRRMQNVDEDYQLMVEWRNRPHVRYWWDPDLPPLTMASARDEYEADTRSDAPSTACIVELDGSPFGFMQFYRWASYAEEADEVGIPFDAQAWGIDIFIGEPDGVGKGTGTRMMRLLCDYLENEQGATSIALTTELTNEVAIRCYEKAGFEKIRQVVDLDTRDGQRTQDWLMIRQL
jgi:RimJ/RimL family protein N-acetyltransferase